MSESFIRASPPFGDLTYCHWVEIPWQSEYRGAQDYHIRLKKFDQETQRNWNGFLVGSGRQVAIVGFKNFEDTVLFLIHALKMNDI